MELTFQQKCDINARVQARYNFLMERGQHGHYETMFQCVHEELKLQREELAVPAASSGALRVTGFWGNPERLVLSDGRSCTITPNLLTAYSAFIASHQPAQPADVEGLAREIVDGISWDDDEISPEQFKANVTNVVTTFLAARDANHTRRLPDMETSGGVTREVNHTRGDATYHAMCVAADGHEEQFKRAEVLQSQCAKLREALAGIINCLHPTDHNGVNKIKEGQGINFGKAVAVSRAALSSGADGGE